MIVKKSKVIALFLALVMMLSSVIQPPTFAQTDGTTQTGVEEWVSLGDIAGTDRDVNAMVVDGAGNLYAGGPFTAAGGVAASGVAKWDGGQWSPLGTGLPGVRALAADSAGNLYAGGHGDGWNAANRIAKWDGSAWSPLGTGLNNGAIALALDGAGNLYAGGDFTTAGGSAASRVAKWDGSAWSPLGTGLNGSVWALAADSAGNLYAGGTFTAAGGNAASRVAKWDGATWSPLGTGLNGNVLALALDSEGNLYAGGSFTTAGGSAANCIAKWDGAAWSPLGTGLNSAALSLALDSEGNLYAGGSFTTAGGSAASRIARWNGSAWSPLGAGFDADVNTLAVDSEGSLYAGGRFTYSGGIPAGGAARWDGAAWSSLGAGTGINRALQGSYLPPPMVSALAADSVGNLYAGGSFTHAGGVAANRIARWDGASWLPLGTGLNGDVNALAVDSAGNLYAGGSFTNAGGVAANRVARWDGSSWHSLGSGVQGDVRALSVDSDDNLYAGGSFSTAGGSPASRIARWDGTSWNALSTGLFGGNFADVYALAVDGNDNLYAGGEFNQGGGTFTKNIARWDGFTWHPLGAGLNNEVRALAVDSAGNLYAGGSFTSAGGAVASRIARWDGSSWHPLGTGAHGGVRALSVDSDDNLYAGGSFSTAGGSPASRIARWDGASWSPLGTGLNSTVHALTTCGTGNLYAGGEFTIAGNQVSPYAAMYRLSDSEITITDLEEGVARTATYSQGTVRQYYRIDLPSRQNLRLTVDAPEGLVTYLRHGSLPAPSPGGYNHRVQGGGELVIPSATAGNWYVLVHGAIPGNGEYSIMYETFSGLFLTGTNPGRHSTGYPLELNVEGGGFIAPVEVELTGDDGRAFPAKSVNIHSQARLTAAFSAGSLPPGRYGVKVSRPGIESAVMTNVLEIVEGGEPRLEARLILPAFVGYSSWSTIVVEYANTGDVSMPAPLLSVTGIQNGRQGAKLALDRTIVGQGIFVEGMPEGFNSSVQFLASGNTPGILQPGEKRYINIYYGGWLRPWNMDSDRPPIEWELDVVTADDSTPFDWAALKEEMYPDFVSRDAWDAVWANFVAQTGSTRGDYVTMLTRNAVYLHQQGQRVEDIGQLLAFSFRQEDAFHPLSILASGTDTAAIAPGLPLVFERIYQQAISRRFELGPLGRGWRHNWQITLEEQDNDAVAITGINATPRVFQPDIRYPNRYLAEPGDQGTLTRLPGVGFRLREMDGMLQVFHTNGKLHYLEDPNGNRITCRYTGELLTRLEHSSGQWLEINYQGSDRIRSVSDRHGRQTNYTYNGDYLTGVELYDGRSFSYEYNRNAGSAAEHALVSISPPGGPGEEFSYDLRGRLSAFSQGGQVQSTYTYDSAGTVSATDRLGNTSRFFFDYAGRIVKTENPQGGMMRYSFDELGNLTAVTDGTGITETYGYDRRGNLISVTNALGQTSRFTYCRTYNVLTSITDANGNLTTFTYDANGNLTGITYPDGSSERWSRDGKGLVVSSTNRQGNTTSYTYDAYGRLTGKNYAGGSAQYTYNRGFLTSATNENGAVAMEYDNHDYLVKIVYPHGQWLSFEYDDAGRRSSSLDQLGHRLNYHYDGTGRLASIKDGSDTEIVSYRYDQTGRLSRKTVSNSVYDTMHTDFTYDASWRLASLVNSTPGGGEISRFEYTYDARGNRIKADTHYGAWTYQYDDTGQLTRAALSSSKAEIPSQELVYQYDALGNRVSTVINGEPEEYTVNQLNQYSRAGDRDYAYDDDGNLIGESGPGGTTSYAYDNMNRLVSINRGGDTWEYKYDALGNRISVCENVYGNVSETRFIVDPIGLGNVVGEYDANGELIARYTHGLGLLSRSTPAGDIHYYSFDGAGNTSELIDINGNVSNAYAYRPFGELILHDASVANPFQYVGQLGVMADSANLYYMRARHFDPQLGRFTAADPIGITGGDLNLYRYAFNAPTIMVDPTGLTSYCKLGGGAYDIVGGAKKIKLGGGLMKAGVILAKPTAGVSLLVTLAGAGLVYWGGKDIEKGIDTMSEGFAGQGTSTIGEQMAKPFDYDAPLGAFDDVDLWKHQKLYKGDFKNAGKGLGTDLAIRAGIGAVCYWENTNKPDIPGERIWRGKTRVVGALDPNHKASVAGHGPQNHVAGECLLFYRVDFENLESATAPAQIVTIEDPLAAQLDWATFELAQVGFGDIFIPVPGGSQDFHTIVDYTYTDDEITKDIEVEIEAYLEDGVLHVNFFSKDPDTGLPPPANVGFLPPEDGTGRGQGHVVYFIRPKDNLPSGTEIRNVAEIQFDYSMTIYTNQVDPLDPGQGTSPDLEALVTIDAAPPTSSVDTLPAVTVTAIFPVSWSGEDDMSGSGIAGYDVYVRQNGGPWVLWLNDTAGQSENFTGENNSTYSFYCIATDNVGHREVKAPQAESTTTISLTDDPGPEVPALTITTASLPSGRVGSPYNATLTAGGGTSPYTWSASGLPNGLSISSGGLISGAPTAEGTFAVTVTANDSASRSTSKNISLTVNRASPGSSGGGSGGPATVTGTSKDIKAAVGGTVSYGNVTVVIPPGTLPGDARISINKLSTSEADKVVPKGLRVSLAGDIYEITTTGERNFGDKQITIRIAYDPSKIASGKQPVIRYLDETTGQWVDLPTTVEQGADGKWYAVTHVNHLTKFAIFSTQAKETVKKVIVLTLGQQTATVDGSPYTLDAVPYMDQKTKRTLVPIRFISEALGAEVDWNAETRRITIKDGGKEIVLTLGSRDVLVNGEKQTIDSAPATLPPGRTFVPLRFVSETLGAEVHYESATRDITIIR